jgi:hypothetical protein
MALSDLKIGRYQTLRRVLIVTNAASLPLIPLFNVCHSEPSEESAVRKDKADSSQLNRVLKNELFRSL